MVNKKKLVVFVFLTMTTMASCFSVNDETPYIKDLDENMLELRAYHENLGEALKQNDMDLSDWLVNGMDSVLTVMSDNFNKNRKLQKPFSYYYKNRLKPSMGKLKKAIKNGEKTDAINAYSILTNKCNGCHIDHDAGKEVLNWAK